MKTQMKTLIKIQACMETTCLDYKHNIRESRQFHLLWGGMCKTLADRWLIVCSHTTLNYIYVNLGHNHTTNV